MKRSVMNCITRLVRFDWLPEPAFVQLRKISHDDVMVKSAYNAVSSCSTADWVEEAVRKMADNCKTKNGRECCLVFLKLHLEWQESATFTLSNAEIGQSEK